MVRRTRTDSRTEESSPATQRGISTVRGHWLVCWWPGSIRKTSAVPDWEEKLLDVTPLTIHRLFFGEFLCRLQGAERHQKE